MPEPNTTLADTKIGDVQANALLIESALKRGDYDTADRAIRRLEGIVYKQRMLEAVPEAVRDLIAWVPEFSPRARRAAEGVPFLSEAVLYDLLGKEDARTLLAKVRTALVACGCDEGEIRAML